MGMRQLKITNSITNRESPSLEKYLQEISKVEMLLPEEEVRLTRLIKQGDKEALDKLTRANLRFVVSVAKQYQYRGLQLADLINEGNIGMMVAAQRFDDTRGFKFISFAVWYIREAILRALHENSRLIRLPINRVALNNQLRKAKSILEQQLEREPTEDELAEKLNMDVRDVIQSMGSNQRAVSLDEPAMDDGEGGLLETLESPDAANEDNDLTHTQSLKKEISRSLKMLTQRQQEVICYFFGIGQEYSLSLDDIAMKFDLTAERVRQIKDSALMALRRTGSYNLLRGFLGN